MEDVINTHSVLHSSLAHATKKRDSVIIGAQQRIWARTIARKFNMHITELIKKMASNTKAHFL